MGRFRRTAASEPYVPKTHRKVAFRVYYEWVDDDGAVVRGTAVTDRVSTRAAAAAETATYFPGFRAFRVVDTEETVITYTWIGLAGIGFFGHPDPPHRPDWRSP